MTMKRKQAIKDLEAGIESLKHFLVRLADDGVTHTTCGVPILKGVPLDDYLPKSPWPDHRGQKRDCVPTEESLLYLESWTLPRLMEALDEIKSGK